MTDVVRGVRILAATARNERGRNEDAVGVGGWVAHADTPIPLDLTVALPPGAAVGLSVVDGMGGQPNGDMAARIAARRLTADAAESVDQALQAAHGAIRGAATGPAAGMGATAAVVRLHSDGRCAVGNVGDVRVYRVVDGYAGQVTVDDRPSEPERPGAVTACLGGSSTDPVLPHRHDFAVLGGDRLIMVTDGVHDVTAIGSVVEDPLRLVGELLGDVRQRGGGDNATVLVVDVIGDPPHAPAPTLPQALAAEPVPNGAAEPRRGRRFLRRRRR